MIFLETWVASALTSSMLLALPVALLAGLLSFASPCVLPLLPGYLSYASGLGANQISSGQGDRRPLVIGTAGFILGFSLVFVFTGAVVGGLGALLIEHQRIITFVVGLVIIVLGCMFMGVLPMPSAWRPSYTPRAGVAMSPVLGIVFGLTFTPCIGPALSVVLSLAFTEGSVMRGGILAFVYALGLGLPFLLFAVAFSLFAPRLGWLRRNQRILQRIGGAVMIAVGIAMVIGLWDWMMAWMRQWVANFGTIL